MTERATAQFSLFSLDVLPPKCGIETHVGLDLEHFTVSRVRFRASRPRRRWGRTIEEHSEWSGWFEYEGEPIALRWDTFWISDGR